MTEAGIRYEASEINETRKEGIYLKLKLTFNSPAVLGFVTLCFCALMVNQATGGAANHLLFMTYRSSWQDPLTYVRLVTHVFGHSGWEHFIGNMMYILLVGPLLEEKYGSPAIVKLITVTAVVTGLINALLFSNIALYGASGVCFAFILLSSLTRFREGEIPITFILAAAIYFGQQFYEGLFVKDNVSNLGHVLGGIIGSMFGLFFTRRRRRR